MVAEGVEDEATFAELLALGCDMAQGYWLSRPLSSTGLADWARESEWARPGREKVELRRVG